MANGRGALSDWPCPLKNSFHTFHLPWPCPAEMGALQFSYVKPCEWVNTNYETSPTYLCIKIFWLKYLVFFSDL
jgi:hypothetical protein